MTQCGDIRGFVLPSPSSVLPSAPLSVYVLMIILGDHARSERLSLLDKAEVNIGSRTNSKPASQ
jgi:hypothetical protein